MTEEKKVNKGRFSSENQPKKRKGKSERTKFIEALQRRNSSEEEFYDSLVSKAMDEDSPIAISEILKRVSPIPKQVAPAIEFDLDKDAKPHQKAEQILDAISTGQIPPDIGSTLISSIKAFVDIEEFTELKRRIEKLEEKLTIG